MTGGPNYWMYPNDTIAQVNRSMIDYSTNGGQTVRTYRTPDRETILSLTWGDYLYF